MVTLGKNAFGNFIGIIIMLRSRFRAKFKIYFF